MGEEDLSAVASDLSATRDLRMRQIEAQMQNARDSIAVQREQIAVARGRAAADAWYQRATIKINQMELALKAELGRREAALNEAKTYAEYASTPDNYFKLLDMASGYGGRLPQPEFLRRMQSGEQQVLFTQPGGVPTPHGQLDSMWGPGFDQQQGEKGGSSTSGGKIESAYGALPGTTPPSPFNQPNNYLGVPLSGYSPYDINALRSIGDVYARGFSKLGPQAWEMLP